MKIFIKRFWGFDVNWPIVSFSQRGSLKALLDQSGSGDLMAFVGTLGPNTPAANERGRLLGLAEFGRTPIHSRTALPEQSFATAPKGPDGDIKWPFAVVMTRAWRFLDDPLPIVTEVLGRQLPMAAISNAVLLTDEEKARILALPRKEFDVAVTRTIWDERDAVSQLVGPGGTMGPIPSSFLSTAHRDALKPAVTYAFRFANKDVWKVGWTHDLKARLDDINKHVPHEALGGQCWKGWLIQKWASAQQAYDMEQRVLSECEGSSKYGERVHCSEDLFQQLWVKARKM